MKSEALKSFVRAGLHVRYEERHQLRQCGNVFEGKCLSTCAVVYACYLWIISTFVKVRFHYRVVLKCYCDQNNKSYFSLDFKTMLIKH